MIVLFRHSNFKHNPNQLTVLFFSIITPTTGTSTNVKEATATIGPINPNKIGINPKYTKEPSTVSPNTTIYTTIDPKNTELGAFLRKKTCPREIDLQDLDPDFYLPPDIEHLFRHVKKPSKPVVVAQRIAGRSELRPVVYLDQHVVNVSDKWSQQAVLQRGKDILSRVYMYGKGVMEESCGNKHRINLVNIMNSNKMRRHLRTSTDNTVVICPHETSRNPHFLYLSRKSKSGGYNSRDATSRARETEKWKSYGEMGGSRPNEEKNMMTLDVTNTNMVFDSIQANTKNGKDQRIVQTWTNCKKTASDKDAEFSDICLSYPHKITVASSSNDVACDVVQKQKKQHSLQAGAYCHNCDNCQLHLDCTGGICGMDDIEKEQHRTAGFAKPTLSKTSVEQMYDLQTQAFRLMNRDLNLDADKIQKVFKKCKDIENILDTAAISRELVIPEYGVEVGRHGLYKGFAVIQLNKDFDSSKPLCFQTKHRQRKNVKWDISIYLVMRFVLFCPSLDLHGTKTLHHSCLDKDKYCRTLIQIVPAWKKSEKNKRSLEDFEGEDIVSGIHTVSKKRNTNGSSKTNLSWQQLKELPLDAPVIYTYQGYDDSLYGATIQSWSKDHFDIEKVCLKDNYGDETIMITEQRLNLGWFNVYGVV